MKKKVLALVCAMTLVFGGAMNVCAAGSVTAGDVQQAVTDVKNDLPAGTDLKVEADGSINVSVSSVSVSVSANAEFAAVASTAVVTTVANAAPGLTVTPLDATQAAAPLAKIAAKLAAVVANEEGLSSNVKVQSVATAFVADITATAAGKVAFSVATINSGSGAKIDTDAWIKGTQRVYALHYTGSGVERIDCQFENGNIVFGMSSFSPVAIVVEDLVLVGDDDNDAPAADAGTSSNGAPVSPKTADVSAAAAVVVIAMMSVAALVVLKRRVRA